MKTRLVLVLAMALGAMGMSVNTPVLVAQPAFPSAAIDSARRIVEQVVALERLPGFAVTVSRGRGNEAVIWEQGFGFADIGAQVPATPQTQFRIGSVSKLLTVAAMVRLSQSGGLDLDAPIKRYLPELPGQLGAVTLQQLAGHLGGVRHYRGTEFLSNTHYETLGEAITIFVNDSLIAAPGSTYFYTSYGYNLMGAVLERVTGKLFPMLMQDLVLDPLGMRATVPDRKGTAIPFRARTYVVGSAGVNEAPADDLSSRWPSGGYLSTTSDVARLGRALLDTVMWNAPSRTTMLTSQYLSSGTPTSVGLGWRIGADSAQRRYVHHAGASNGGRAVLLVYPDQQLVVALATNAMAQWDVKLALSIASVFMK